MVNLEPGHRNSRSQSALSPLRALLEAKRPLSAATEGLRKSLRMVDGRTAERQNCLAVSEVGRLLHQTQSFLGKKNTAHVIRERVLCPPGLLVLHFSFASGAFRGSISPVNLRSSLLEDVGFEASLCPQFFSALLLHVADSRHTFFRICTSLTYGSADSKARSPLYLAPFFCTDRYWGLVLTRCLYSPLPL